MSLMSWRRLGENGEPYGQTYYFEFDAVVAEEFIRPANLTEYPVEGGGILHDHYQPLPYQITVTGVVSDTPIVVRPQLEGLTNAAAVAATGYPTIAVDAPAAAQRSQGIVVRPVVGLPSARLVRGNIERSRLPIPQRAKVLNFAEPVTRTTDVFRIIDELMENRIPVNLIAIGDLEFQNMMIINHRAPRLSGSGGSIEFTIDLRQVRTASPTKTKAPEQRKEARHSTRRDEGHKDPSPTKPGTKQGADVLQGYFKDIRQVPEGYLWSQ